MKINWVDLGINAIASMRDQSGREIEMHALYAPGKGGDWMWLVEIDGERVGPVEFSGSRADARRAAEGALLAALEGRDD